ncbi:hypothetical protein QNO09_15540 [Streptomyces sp. 378]|uniref:hypothetical protein n=1 Tax=Streptomyces sp. 378 TaxID=3049412 RepID=UPI0024C3AF4B|nr:hypothetical protein [Streptomyces sp. 378]MDK1344695.1 hypothetical protein [Streptomyces sp. 378]
MGAAAVSHSRLAADVVAVPVRRVQSCSPAQPALATTVVGGITDHCGADLIFRKANGSTQGTGQVPLP